jgi:hypothetical protein
VLTVALSIFAKSCLFLSSYVPLWTILILFHLGDWGWWLAVPLGALIGGLAGLVILRHWVLTGSDSEITIDYANRQDSDSVAYIVTYIFPFLTLAISSIPEALGIIGLFLTIMLVYVSSDMLYVNPILSALGWHAHSVHTKGGAELVLLTRRRLIREGQVLHAVRLGDVIWWEAKA